MNTPTNNSCSSSKQDVLEIVIAELERSLVTLETNYQKAVSNLATLRECVDTDDLTRLLRRGAFMRKLQRLLLQSSDEGREVHLLMIDVDHFKRVNDTHGHQTGDVVLQQISQLIATYLRPQDIAGRFGGEEIIVAVQAGADDALAIAERIRVAVQAHCTRSVEMQKEVKVTLSMGIASTQQFKHEADVLIARADAALYRAKKSGRNRIVQAGLEAGHDDKSRRNDRRAA